jgi:ankyrin repeat protein
MQIAARNGSVAMLALLLQSGGALDTTGPKGDSLFHLAAYNGHLPAMRWLQSNGISSDAVDIAGQTAVHVACKRGEPLVLSYLYEECKSDFMKLDFEGKNPLDCIPKFGEDEERKLSLAECRRIVTQATADVIRRIKMKEASEAKKAKRLMDE